MFQVNSRQSKMPPKKKKSGKKKKGKQSGKKSPAKPSQPQDQLSELTKEFYNIQIRDLENRLARFVFSQSACSKDYL